MFWRKKPTATAAADGAATGPARQLDPESERALEATAQILRALGRYAFDVGETPARSVTDAFERWAAHVLVLGPPPGEEPDPKGAPPERRREWARLGRFVGEQRQREQQYVLQTTTEMRDVILTLVRCFGRTSLDQRRSSAKLGARVDRLRASVESHSLDELRASALAVAEAVTEALEEQERRTEAQTRELREKLSRLQADLDKANREGSTDPLTKLQNRRVFDGAVERCVALATVLGHRVSLVMVDVDHFKCVNDRYGHPVGDRVIRAIADALLRAFPRRGDIVTRYGGEEFACLLTETPQRDARVLADRLLASIRKLRIEHAGDELSVTVSVGVGEYAAGESGEEFVARVDRALYEAKAAGRDRCAEAGRA